MNIRNHKSFIGPLFIVGMPRSGTKLLRGLLNEHPCIGILTIETNFLPVWVNNWQCYGDLSNPSVFNEFYRKMLQFSYFKFMKDEGRLIDKNIWYNLCRSFTPAGTFEALARHDAKVEYDALKIWGDKTPSYIRYIPLLKDIYPEARFIHIIRDVRDYCLSINKAWGKNMIRAAQRWCDDVHKANLDGKELDGDYLEVKYEDLITETDLILKKICNFLDIEFDSQMTHLSKPSEEIGDAKDLRGIKKDNREKYLRLMAPNMRYKIETITVSVLKSCGYFVNYSGEKKRVNPIKMICYKLFDGVNLFKFNIMERGLYKAIKWNINRMLSW